MYHLERVGRTQQHTWKVPCGGWNRSSGNTTSASTIHAPLEWWQGKRVGQRFIELLNSCPAGWVVCMGCVQGGESKINSVMKYLAVHGKRQGAEMELLQSVGEEWQCTF